MKDEVLDSIVLDINNVRAVLISNNHSIRITPNIFIDGIAKATEATEELWQIIQLFYDESDI